jgi:hypothetical protein
MAHLWHHHVGRSRAWTQQRYDRLQSPPDLANYRTNPIPQTHRKIRATSSTIITFGGPAPARTAGTTGYNTAPPGHSQNKPNFTTHAANRPLRPGQGLHPSPKTTERTQFPLRTGKSRRPSTSRFAKQTQLRPGHRRPQGLPNKANLLRSTLPPTKQWGYHMDTGS